MKRRTPLQGRLRAALLPSVALAALCGACSQADVPPPAPVYPVPEAKQVAWQQMETYAFIHFGLNTFSGTEWGYGDTDPSVFSPSRLDCEQWVRTLQEAGMKGVILTAKHHDGFCLWPFAGTDYNISRTPFRGGKGDVVRELSDACRRHGMKFAVYLSPWDRHRADYGTPSYVDYFHAQLRDLLTRYGDVFEVWFDGANGGDGWYGGARDVRTIDRRTYYDYPRIHALLDSIQPQAVVFSDGGPGCRWVGNEKGFAGATNWSFLRRGEVYPGYPKPYELQYGHADGDQWVPAECDVSIRPGWFYHPEEDARVKTPAQLVDLYYRSVGHNATLLLNFPVGRDGLIHPVDSANAAAFRKQVLRELGNNLVSGMKPETSAGRGGRYTASALTDDDYDTYWATPDGTCTGDITFRFPSPCRMNRLLLQEYIPLGQRVKSFTVEYRDGSRWRPVQADEETTTVGYKRILRFRTVVSDGIRIRITDARGPLCLNNVGVYDAGPQADAAFPASSGMERGLPFTLCGGAADSLRAASDGDPRTVCLIAGDRLLVDLGEERTVSSFHYLPDQSECGKGFIANYELSVATQAGQAVRVLRAGEFSNIRNNPVMQSVHFIPVTARYLCLRAVRMVTEGEPIGVAEIAVR